MDVSDAVVAAESCDYCEKKITIKSRKPFIGESGKLYIIHNACARKLFNCCYHISEKNQYAKPEELSYLMDLRPKIKGDILVGMPDEYIRTFAIYKGNIRKAARQHFKYYDELIDANMIVLY